MACSYHAETRTDEKSYSATREKEKIVRQMATGIMIMGSSGAGKTTLGYREL